MNAEINRTRPRTRLLAIPVLITALTLGLIPPSAAADTTTVSERDIVKIIDSAVSYHLEKNLLHRVIDSACYFDPGVDDSMWCQWASNIGGADPFRLQQKVKRRAKKGCKQAGGRKCVLFWRNGSLRFDGLLPVQAERLESVLLNISSRDSEALPLPKGANVAFSFRTHFEDMRDYWERRRKKYRGRNPHYALCNNEYGPRASFVTFGGGGICPTFASDAS